MHFEHNKYAFLHYLSKKKGLASFIFYGLNFQRITKQDLVWL